MKILISIIDKTRLDRMRNIIFNKRQISRNGYGKDCKTTRVGVENGRRVVDSRLIKKVKRNLKKELARDGKKTRHRSRKRIYICTRVYIW